MEFVTYENCDYLQPVRSVVTHPLPVPHKAKIEKSPENCVVHIPLQLLSRMSVQTDSNIDLSLQQQFTNENNFDDKRVSDVSVQTDSKKMTTFKRPEDGKKDGILYLLRILIRKQVSHNQILICILVLSFLMLLLHIIQVLLMRNCTYWMLIYRYLGILVMN